MARQWIIPDFGFINEDGEEEYVVPGYGFIGEDQPEAVAAAPVLRKPIWNYLRTLLAR